MEAFVRPLKSDSILQQNWYRTPLTLEGSSEFPTPRNSEPTGLRNLHWVRLQMYLYCFQKNRFFDGDGRFLHRLQNWATCEVISGICELSIKRALVNGIVV